MATRLCNQESLVKVCGQGYQTTSVHAAVLSLVLVRNLITGDAKALNEANHELIPISADIGPQLLTTLWISVTF